MRAGDSPFGAAVIVSRRNPQLDVLLLHRAAEGPDYGGDWAWAPPAGARYPAEPIDDCAARETHQEIGLDLVPDLVEVAETTVWAIYAAEVPSDVSIQLDAEHDRYEWLPAAAAVERCLPSSVAECISRALGGVRDDQGRQPDRSLPTD